MKGILLINTGSPKTYKRSDVKYFITQMLSDPQVMTVPDWFRPILVKGIIAPLRQFISAKRYSLIWDYTHKSSPLIYHSKLLAEKLEKFSGVPTEIAMRYGEPEIGSTIEKLLQKTEALTELIVLPLFPHYAQSSSKTSTDAVCACVLKKSYNFTLKIIEPYFANQQYIRSLADSIRPYLETSGGKLIFNFHSLPVKVVESGWSKGNEFDYVYQTKETIKLVQKELGLTPHDIRLTYSSAMGRNWLKPDLNDMIKCLIKGGTKDIVVVSPGFAADNLETLYDINIVAKNTFKKCGGQKFTYIPCLNSSDDWVRAINNIIG